jgi:hypothetical protein
MKSLLGAIAATLIGAAMLVGGIVGVAGGFDGDDSSDSSSAEATEDVANFDRCSTADDRFDEFNSIEVLGDAGRGTVLVSCQGGVVELSMIASSLPAEESRTVALWLYNNRKDADLIAYGQQEPGDDTVVLSSRLPTGSANYEKLVVTEGPPLPDLDEPAAPGRVILQARL